MTSSIPHLHQGDCIQLPDDGEDGPLYQVIGVDDRGDRCWLRRWPMARQGSPVFEIPLHQLQRPPKSQHRPVPAGRHEG